MKRALTFISGLLFSICFYMIFSLDSYAYTVQSGDTLGKIAADNGMTLEELLSYNNIADPNLIFPGQEINLGKTENTDPYKRVNLTNDEKQLIKTLFDAEYYKNENPDVVAIYGEDPEKLFDHFLTYGLWETRQPNADFNVNAYASAYDDVRKAYKNANLGEMVKNITIHYALFGKTEGREITTIEECLAEGKEVLYYGAYDDATQPTAPEHIIATVPEEDSDEVSAPVPTTHNLKDIFYKDVWTEISKAAEMLNVHGFDYMNVDIDTYIGGLNLDDYWEGFEESFRWAYDFASFGRTHEMTDENASIWFSKVFLNFFAEDVFAEFISDEIENPSTQIDAWVEEYEEISDAGNLRLSEYAMRALMDAEFDDANLLIAKFSSGEISASDREEIVDIVGYCGYALFMLALGE